MKGYEKKLRDQNTTKKKRKMNQFQNMDQQNRQQDEGYCVSRFLTTPLSFVTKLVKLITPSLFFDFSENYASQKELLDNFSYRPENNNRNHDENAKNQKFHHSITLKNKQNIYFKPNSEVDVLKIMVKIANNTEFSRIFWDFGEKLNDQKLFLKTWNYLIIYDNEYLNKFSFDQGFYDQLFDHYSFFLDINPIATIQHSDDIRIQLLSFMIDFLISKWNLLSSNVKHASYIWMRVFKFLNFSSPEAQVSIFLLISKLHKNLMKYTANSDTHLRINKMLDLMSPNTTVFNQLIQLSIETGQLGSTQITLAYYILKMHFFDQNDVALIEKIIMSPCPKNPLCIFQILMTKTIFKHKILSSSIILTCCKMIPRFRKINGFKEWMMEYIDSAFEMLYCLDSSSKYIWKRSILVNMLENLSIIKIQWLNRAIRSNITAIHHIGKCTDILRNTHNSKTIDEFKLQHFQNIMILESNTYKHPFKHMSIDFPDKTLPTREFYSLRI